MPHHDTARRDRNQCDSGTSAELKTPRLFKALAQGVMVLMAGLGSAHAASVHLLVDRTDDVLAGASVCDPFVLNDCSLRGAISHANGVAPADDVFIELDAAIYTLAFGGIAENGNLAGDLDILRDMTLEGQGMHHTLILPLPGFVGRFLDIAAGQTVTLSGMQFAVSKPAGDLRSVLARQGVHLTLNEVAFRSNGTLAGGGGGLHLEDGSVALLEDCLFENNHTGLNGGGAIRSRATSLTVRDTRFYLNQAQGGPGGAIQLLPPAVGETTNLFERVVIEDSLAPAGGGVYSEKFTETTFVDSTLRRNIADDGAGGGRGGALYTTGLVEFEGSTMNANTAVELGAAIFAEHDGHPVSRVDTTNTTISGHRSPAGVAAIYFYSTDDSWFLHTTFYDNDQDFFGDSPFHVHVQNSVFGSGCLIMGYNSLSAGGNVGVDGSCWSDLPAAGDTVVGSLQLEDLGQYGGVAKTHLPLAGSPVLGVPVACLPIDQRGEARPMGGCASGAVERLVPEPAVFFGGFETGDASRWSAAVP